MLIIVMGMSGCGKSTLINKCKKLKGVHAYDVDDITDREALALFKEYPLMDKLEQNAFFSVLEVRVNRQLQELAVKYKDEILVINDIIHRFRGHHNFFVDCDPVESRIRQMERDIPRFVRYADEIKKQLRENYDLALLMILYKAEVRVPIGIRTDSESLIKLYEEKKSDYAKQGFQIKKIDDIYAFVKEKSGGEIAGAARSTRRRR